MELPYYDTFEHEADVGIVGKGRTMEEAFIGGARALMEVMFDTSDVDASVEIEIECSSFDLESLFVEWLNNLITERELRGLVFSRFEAEISEKEGEGDDEPLVLRGRARGEPLDKERHDIRVEVKGATYNSLSVGQEEDSGLYYARCVVDV